MSQTNTVGLGVSFALLLVLWLTVYWVAERAEKERRKEIAEKWMRMTGTVVDVYRYKLYFVFNYEYTYEGKTYHGTDTASKKGAHRKGSSVPIFVNPKLPSSSAVRRDEI